MKIIKIGLSLLLVNYLLADNKTLEIKNNKNINNQAEIESGIIADIDKDGKNINFLLKIMGLNDDTVYFDKSQMLGRSNQYIIGTAGISFLPNTWKINLSYSGVLTNEFNQKEKEATYEYSLTHNNAIINEKPKDMEVIDVYMKPISTKYGDIGFGYNSVKKNTLLIGNKDNEYAIKVLDIKNPNSNESISFENNYKYAMYNSNITTYYLTYNIPTKRKWYQGLGVFYGYETSNVSIVKKKNNLVYVILKPDTTSHLIGVGINKTFDELSNGFNLKNFMIGTATSEYEFYNFDTKENEKGTMKKQYLNASVSYLFNKNKNKSIFITTKTRIYSDNLTDIEVNSYKELSLELGIIF